MLDGLSGRAIVHQEMQRRRFKLITRAVDLNAYSGAVRRESVGGRSEREVKRNDDGQHSSSRFEADRNINQHNHRVSGSQRGG
jgi:hypothetical protein